MSAHITSFVILCHPRQRREVRDAAAALPGVEIHHCGEDGKIIALAEGANEHAIGDALLRLQSTPGVIAANMVYHGIDIDEGEQRHGD